MTVHHYFSVLYEEASFFSYEYLGEGKQPAGGEMLMRVIPLYDHHLNYQSAA